MNFLISLNISFLFLITLCSSSFEANSCNRWFLTKDPDANKSVCELIESAGFKCTTKYLITEDGYILALFRIINPKVKELKRPVILVHGLTANAAYFIMNAPGNGTEFSNYTFNGQPVSNNLGYALSMNGYDVWLVSYRGDLQSTNHTKLDTKSEEYWRFSQDERIKYDLPTIIDYIQTQNKSPKISYIGHSQGTTIMFGLLASIPKYNDIIDIAIGLTPVARVKHNKALFVKSISTRPLFSLLKLKAGPALFPYKIGKSGLISSSLSCPILKNIIEPFLFKTFVGPTINFNSSRAHVYFNNFEGDSMWSVIRYLQHQDSFRYFDYGEKENLRIYGTKDVPSYDLSKINTNICLFSGTNDYLATREDVEFIVKNLQPDILKCNEIEEGWNHLDFGLGLKMSKINVKILEVLKQYD